MRKTLSIVVLFIIFMNCQNNDDDGLDYPYYEFSEADNNLIINHNYENETILTYKNQDGQTLHFKVVEVLEGKNNQYSIGTFSGGGGSLEAYFDRKIIRLEIVENEINYLCCDQINYIFSKRENVFKFGFKFPLWNKFSSTFIDEVQNPIDIQINNQNNYDFEVLELNNVIYNRVIKFQSNLTDEYNRSTNLEVFVNEVFYDLNYGIIQFKDVDGMIWKLTDE